MGELAEAVQEATGELVELAYVDQGYTGERPAAEAEAHGIRLEVVKHPEAKRGFVLLPRRWVVERDFASWGFARHRDFGAWSKTMSGYPRPWWGCTSLRSLVSSFNKQPPSSARVHNSL